jgi:hypothetical protein
MAYCTSEILDTGAVTPAAGTIRAGAASIGIQNLGPGDATFNGYTIKPTTPYFTLIAEKNGLFGALAYNAGAGRLFMIVNRPAA